MLLKWNILFILLLFTGNSFGAYEVETFNYKLHPLKFSNRARCALDSKEPARSAFLMLSNMDAAKAVYRVAKFRNEATKGGVKNFRLGDLKMTGLVHSLDKLQSNDRVEITKKGIEKFRFSVLQMIAIIHKRLINGELPLLPADLSQEQQEQKDIQIPSKYESVMSSCRLDEYCTELDKYLDKIWNISYERNHQSSDKPIKELYSQIDNFDEKAHFMSEKDLKNKKNKKLSCSYLKKFGPLQANLFGTKPNLQAFKRIAGSVENMEQEYGPCDKFSPQESLEVGAYQLVLPKFTKKAWKAKGFDYWNSVKIYVSYAFRRAPEMKAAADPFGLIFQGVSLEESLMFVPDSCNSLAPAKCDGDRLALNSMREFAKKDFKKNAVQLDTLSMTPDGPTEALLENIAPEVNMDQLDLSAHKTASQWLEKLSTNLSSSRAMMKRRLIKSVTFFNILLKSIPVDKLISQLDNQFGGFLSNPKVKLSEKEKNELYYICSEYSFVQHEKWSFIRADLEVLEQSKITDGLTSQISKEKTSKFFDYFMKLGTKLNKFCYSLKQHDIWDDSFSLDKTGFSPWYVDRVYEGKVKSSYNSKIQVYLQESEPLLAYSQYKKDPLPENVVCGHAADCVRKVAESILALYSATEYASTFWSLEKKIKSPDLFNPYAERTACKVYDPWYKTRATMFGFLWDMGQAALSAFVPGMIYTRMSLKPGMVTSFKKLVKDGVLEYDIKYSKQKVLSSVMADFGPLTGVPCAVAINETVYNPLDPIMFSGISIGSCTSEEAYHIHVNSASDIGPNDKKENSKCFACRLNFESASGVAAYATGNVGPGFFIFRGLYNLFRALQDPHNIPRSWSVDPYDVAEAKVFHSEVGEGCLSKLRKGEKCLDACGVKVSEALSGRLKKPGYITEFNLSPFKGEGVVKHSGCEDGDIKVSLGFIHTLAPGPRGCNISEIKIPPACERK